MKELCENCSSAQILSTGCTAYIRPNWFWYKDVPYEFRATPQELAEYSYSAEQRLSALKNSLKPNKCQAAIMSDARYHRWSVCGRPAPDGEVCKIHKKILDAGAYSPGLQKKYQGQF